MYINNEPDKLSRVSLYRLFISKHGCKPLAGYAFRFGLMVY